MSIDSKVFCYLNSEVVVIKPIFITKQQLDHVIYTKKLCFSSGLQHSLSAIWSKFKFVSASDFLV